MAAVRFTLSVSAHRYMVAFAYNPAVVQLLKDTVPGYARSWVASCKEWEVDTTWADILATALRGAGHTVIGLEHREPEQPRSIELDWATLLFRRVGPARTASVFRALSRCLHPDTPTGDKQLQQELNDAHAAMERR